MITFPSKQTHTWIYTACIVLTAVGLLCLQNWRSLRLRPARRPTCRYRKQ